MTRDSDRLCDLMKQGFMKPRSAKVKKQTPAAETIACDDCLNWHRPRRHTADAATRKANRDARRKRLAGGNP